LLLLNPVLIQIDKGGYRTTSFPPSTS